VASAKNVIADSLSISAGELRISAKASASDPSGTSKVASLSVSPGAVLDLTNNSAAIEYAGGSPLNTIGSWIMSGYAGGSWSGTGIISSSAASNNALPGAHITALGYGEASSIFSGFPALFVGQGVDSSSVLIRYTLAGDANLDGIVDTIDFNLLAENFSEGSKSWTDGDFNYDGNVDTTDFNLLAANFAQTLSAAATLPGVGIIPEPASLLYSAICCVTLIRIHGRNFGASPSGRTKRS
jgi:hypothetical protein